MFCRNLLIFQASLSSTQFLLTNTPYISNTDYAASATSTRLSHVDHQLQTQGRDGILNRSNLASDPIPTQTTPKYGIDADLVSHLNDIKMLRIKLEQSEELNSRLREQLEKHLKNAAGKGE